MKSAMHRAGVVALFTLLACAHTWPLAARLSTHAQAGPDPRAMLWSLFDQTRNLVEQPLRFTDASVFYPFADTLVVLDHQISNAVLAVPLYLLGASGVTIFNLVLLATFVISGVTTFLLVRKLTDSRAAGVVAGCAFAFGTARVYNLEHIHLMSTQWIPLAMLAIHRYLERPTPWRWVGLTASALAVAASSWQIGIIGAFGLGIVALWTLVGDGGPIVRRGLGLLLAASVVGATLLPLAMTYARVAGYWSAGATTEEQVEGGVIAQNSANIVDVVALPFESRAPYAALLARRGTTLFVGIVSLMLAIPALVRLRRSVAAGEGAGARIARLALVGTGGLAAVAVAAALIGGPLESLARLLAWTSPVALFGLALALASLMLARRVGPDRPEALTLLTYGTLTVAGLLLALGPKVMVGPVDLGSGLWRFDLLPIDLSLRAPVRLSLMMGLGLAVLVGFGARELLQRAPARQRLAVLIGLLFLVNVDLAFGFPAWSEVPLPNSVDRWLATADEEGAVLEFPLLGHYWGIYASQEFYDRRNVDGMGYIRPPEIRRLRLLDDFSTLQMDMLWEHFHPRFVVVRGGKYPPAERQRVEQAITAFGGALDLRTSDGDDAVYELSDRGRGPRLFRRWPASFLLRSGRRLSLSAALTEGHDRTIGTLTVLLNDRELFSERGPAIAGRPQHVIGFEPEDLVPGINTFEIRAGYRYREGAAPNPVGGTGASVAADLELVVSAEEAYVAVNGTRYEANAGGLAVAVAPGSGEVVATADLPQDEEAAALGAWLDARAEGTIIAVVVRNDAAIGLDGPLAAELRRLGLAVQGDGAGTEAYAGVGVLGAAPATAVESSGAEARLAIGEPERRRAQLRRLEIW